MEIILQWSIYEMYETIVQTTISAIYAVTVLKLNFER